MVKTEIIEKLSVFSTGAFGLVAALAWNSAIQKIFQNTFGEHSSVGAMLGYALLVTVIAVLVTVWIGWLAERAKKMEFTRLLRRKKEAEVALAEVKLEEAKAKAETKKK